MAERRGNTPLFPKKVLDNLIDGDFFPIDAQEQLRATAAQWEEDFGTKRLRPGKEIAYYRQFINQFWVDGLGYRGETESDRQAAYTLTEQPSLGKGTGSVPDLALGRFGDPLLPDDLMITVEVKAADKELERSYAGKNSAVLQMLRYLVQSGGNWSVATNFKEFRLYHRDGGLNRFQSWTLVDLATDRRALREFHACLAARSLVERDGEKQTLLDRAFASIGAEQEKITRAFYKDYKGLREQVFAALQDLNPQYDPGVLLSKAQMLLDRLLFIAFAEDRGLLPQDILKKRLEAPRRGEAPKLDNLRELFDGINAGWKELGIARYNGGLFRPDEDLDQLMRLDDRVAEWAKVFYTKDFYDEVSVDVLGHIFEQSISDLEAMRAASRGEVSDKRSSKRKREGVYYTPRYVTEYIVEQTVGAKVRALGLEAAELFAPRLAAAKEKEKPRIEREQLENWRNGIAGLRILDPACGSGAFLLAAFAYLQNTYRLIEARLSDLPDYAPLFDPDDTILQRNLYGVDLNAESVEITKLSLWIATAKWGQALVDLDDTIRMGNSLVADHAVDPRAFDWWKSFPEVEKDGGFDCVIGNPPYVRQERIKALKPYLAGHYQCFDAAADLYTYFYELGLRLLKPGGRLGYISGGSFFRGGFGTPLRRHLREHSQVEQILNFGDYRVFADAEMVDPSIVVLVSPEHGASAGYSTRVWANQQKGSLPETGIAEVLDKAGFVVPSSALRDEQWHLAPAATREIAEKLFERGTALGEIAKVQINRGVVTGLNRTEGVNGEGVFVLDRSKRDQLVHEDPQSVDILKPLLEGKDIKPWRLEAQDRWLVFTRRGTKIEDYPAVRAHLESFRERLEPRPPDWKSTPAQEQWPGRKPGDYEWCEIQDNVAYFQEFERTKIIWPDIGKVPRFGRDDSGYYLSNTAYFLPSTSWVVLGMLNSRAMWVALGVISQPLGQRAGLFRYRLFSQYIERLPIPTPSPADERIIAECAEACQGAGQERYELQQGIRHALQRDFFIGKTDKPLSNKLKSWDTLDFATLRAEIKRLTKVDIPIKERAEWEGVLTEERAKIQTLAATIARHETMLNDAVNRAFDLTADECAIVNKVLDPVGTEDGEGED